MTISIIVPVHNVERYILRCLQSIQESSYKDYEVIIIDDGSNDMSGIICEDFCKQDQRFTVIHQENQGVSSARNRGIKLAKGTYISFVDSDDQIHPQMLETLINTIINTKCMVSMILGERVKSHIQHFKQIQTSSPIILEQGEIIENLFSTSQQDWQFCVLWNKLYHKSIIKDINFRDIVGEDTDFNLRTFLGINYLSLVKDCMYYYFENPSSLTNTMHKNKRFIHEICSYVTFLNIIPKEEPIYRAYCLLKLYKRILSVRYFTRNSELSNYSKKIIKDAKKVTYKEFKDNRYIRKKEKTAIFFFMKCPLLYHLYRWYTEKVASLPF